MPAVGDVGEQDRKAKYYELTPAGRRQAEAEVRDGRRVSLATELAPALVAAGNTRTAGASTRLSRRRTGVPWGSCDRSDHHG